MNQNFGDLGESDRFRREVDSQVMEGRKLLEVAAGAIAGLRLTYEEMRTFLTSMIRDSSLKGCEIIEKRNGYHFDAYQEMAATMGGDKNLDTMSGSPEKMADGS